VDGIIYVVGGTPDAQRGVLPVAAYDPRTDTWTNRADIPTARATLAGLQSLRTKEDVAALRGVELG
jgi:ribosomal protein S5